MAEQAQSGSEQVADHTSLPVLALDERQLGDLELILSGAFAPLSGFMSQADVAAVAECGRLADGTPWPIPVTLDVAEDAVPAAADRVLLADPEATPLAVLTITERACLAELEQGAADGARGAHGARASDGGRAADSAPDARIRLAGPVTGHRTPEHGSFRRLMLPPERAKAEFGGVPVLAFATRAPLGRKHIGQLKHIADQLHARLLLLPLTAGQTHLVKQPEALIRSVLAAAASMPTGTRVIPVPLAPRGDRARDIAAVAIVAAAHGATHLMADGDVDVGALPGAPISVVPSGDWAYDPRAEVWRPLGLIQPGTEVEDLSVDQVADMLDTGVELPTWFAPEAVAAELQHARPPRSERGFVVFLTGLSGSGKSTIARDLRDLLAERGDRRVSLLDGDLVRSLLSAGLTFSRADRDLNIARIGYVAAEIAKHGGIAICAPIAPYAAARDRVRQMVSQVGDFLLIHVATPLEVCEARDRKGMYAKARAGIITEFTGISDPYEEPTDAALVIDASVLDREQAVGAIMEMLTSGGWLQSG